MSGNFPRVAGGGAVRRSRADAGATGSAEAGVGSVRGESGMSVGEDLLNESGRTASSALGAGPFAACRAAEKPSRTGRKGISDCRPGCNPFVCAWPFLRSSCGSVADGRSEPGFQQPVMANRPAAAAKRFGGGTAGSSVLAPPDALSPLGSGCGGCGAPAPAFPGPAVQNCRPKSRMTPLSEEAESPSRCSTAKFTAAGPSNETPARTWPDVSPSERSA